MRFLAWGVAVLAGAAAGFLPSVACGDEPPPAVTATATATAKPAQTRWYGWQTLLFDGASIVGVASGGVAMPVGLIGYFFGGPVVHFAHEHVLKGLGDIGMRLVGALGGTVAAATYLYGDRGANDTPAIVLLAVGAGIPCVVDAAALSWEEVPVEPDHASRVAPTVSVAREHGGGTRTIAGFAGRF